MPGQLGLEATPDEYVARMVEVFREVKRVLRDDGVLWLNLGDSYATHARGHNGFGSSTLDASAQHVQLLTGTHRRGDNRYSAPAIGLKDKDLIGVPWMLAFALRADGWWLRSDIVWSKANPMPESVRDRPTRSHEYVFLLSKRERYFYDADAIREPHTAFGRPPGNKSRIYFDRDPAHQTGEKRRPGQAKSFHALGRNKRDVWTCATHAYPEAHFATFPAKLIEPCVLAGTSPHACETCGAPWQRMTETHNPSKAANSGRDMTGGAAKTSNPQTSAGLHRNGGGVYSSVVFRGWRPTCRCAPERNTGAGKSFVLDPFGGAGTTGMVAKRHSRSYLLIELNEQYCEMARKRIAAQIQPVLWSIA